MTEKSFYPIIINSFENAGGWAYKIPDFPISYIKNNEKIRFLKKKPLDIVAVISGVSYYIEAKFSRGVTGFSPSKMADHQMEALQKIRDNQSFDNSSIRPMVFYCCYIPREMKRIYALPLEWFEGGLISKKELLRLPYIAIKKNLFDANQLNEFTLYRRSKNE